MDEKDEKRVLSNLFILNTEKPYAQSFTFSDDTAYKLSKQILTMTMVMAKDMDSCRVIISILPIQGSIS